MIQRDLSAVTRRAVTTATSAVRHPIGTTARVAGFVKGTAVAAPRLVRHAVAGPPDPGPARPAPPAAPTGPRPATASRAEPPGPRTVPRPVPASDDLPEPIVIEGEDPAAGEAVHHEPKVAGRDAAHGRGAGDVEARSGFVDELLADEADPAGTPRDEPVLDPGAASAARSEAAMLRRAADPRPE